VSRRASTHRYPRTARVNEVVLEVLADEIERLSDPRLGFVTLTGVDVTSDLRDATVYYSSVGEHGGNAPDAETGKTAAALVSAAPRLRSALGRQVRLKYLPRLAFVEDPAIAEGQRVEAIIREIHRREGSEGDDAGRGEDHAQAQESS